ncbi:transposon-encoded TnpW family protein [Vermiculatibacterium agrestimuris]|uniref:transposon-encoded TnpW family protein n=1 Tax=Vermiculatibacterium agrestimuris TaxID=2941519 RepID=UPI002040211D|nr:transposon-encoded TnpW family protein [Vermiculatibacterium agrestimuris]
MNIIKLELTEQEAKIYDEVMEQIEKTAAFLVGLSHEERLDWLKKHQYSRPISFEREIDGTIYTVNAHFSENTETVEGKINRILNQNITL